MKKKIVVFTGAGVSADSGISTFRDSDGLWDRYRIEDVCTPEALENQRETVVRFYNLRRKELLETSPNEGHYALMHLEQYFDVEIITQNIDDLHERAGSRRVTHLHGELRKLRSSKNESSVFPLDGWEQKTEDRAPDGSLLRPFVVFFGESVPMFEPAVEIAATADIFIVAGTSLNVYPAASLIRYIRPEIPVYVVDPGEPNLSGICNPVKVIRKNSAVGLPELKNILLEKESIKN